MVVPNILPTKNDHFGVFWGYHHFGNPHIGGDTNAPPKIKLQNYGLGSDLPLLGEGFLTVRSYCQKRVCLHFELANGCTPENSVGTQFCGGLVQMNFRIFRMGDVFFVPAVHFQGRSFGGISAAGQSQMSTWCGCHIICWA